MTLILRIIAWLLTAAVTFATLGPPGYRPHSALGQDAEHALAFVLVGLAFGLAYPRRRRLTAGIAVVLIGVLELLQLWMPGRSDLCFATTNRQDILIAMANQVDAIIVIGSANSSNTMALVNVAYNIRPCGRTTSE